MKTVIITGSNKGLGRELALEFSKNHNVIINGRDLETLQEVYSKIPNGRGYILVGDIREETTLKYMEEESRNRNLDILVNNAGIYSGSLREIMDVNFFSPIDLTERILPLFKAKKSGLIININSIAGKQGGHGESAYSASKHALRGYFDPLRYEVTKYGIRILDVYLGAMETQMTNKRKDQNLFMSPKEVAKVIVKNCELYESLSVDEISLGRINYEF